MSRSNNENLPYVSSPDISSGYETAAKEPKYPILHISEIERDEAREKALRMQLPENVRMYLRPHQKVIDSRYRQTEMPEHMPTALETIMAASGVGHIEDIGKRPTVASVNPVEGGERSRYQVRHHRDDDEVANHLYHQFPKLLDMSVVSSAETQGVENELYIEGRPHRQEKPGSIILRDGDRSDPVIKKFSKYQGWDFPFYGSVDAPLTFITSIARLQKDDPAYLWRRMYNSRAGYPNPRKMIEAFKLSVDWLLEKSLENKEGLIEYKNPIKNGGMRNQGWRDSASAMVHADGQWANSSQGISSIEVQGFAYDALREAQRIYTDVFNDPEKAGILGERADLVQCTVLEKGYIEDSRGGYFVSGFDRDDNGILRPMAVRTSAMGRLLGSSLVKTGRPQDWEKIKQTVLTITSPEMLNRWGIRTMSSEEPAYVPFLYHRGPVWLHDSNDIAANLSNLGLYGADRLIGGSTTNLVGTTGFFPEFTTGDDDEEPIFPERDTYVYDELYDEVYLFEQHPPFWQTWGASSEAYKEYRYSSLIPAEATSSWAQEVERQVIANRPDLVRSD